MGKVEELSKVNILEPMNISEIASVLQNIVLLPKSDIDEMREKNIQDFLINKLIIFIKLYCIL